MKKICLYLLPYLMLAFSTMGCNPDVTEPDNNKPDVENPDIEKPGDENPSEGQTKELKISSFRMMMKNNEGNLQEDVIFSVKGSEISGDITSLADLRSIVVDFIANGKVFVGDVGQESGVTANDFTKPVTYRVEGENGESKEYTIKIDHFTGLPIVYFDTDSGKGVANKEDWEGATIRIVGTEDAIGLEEMKVQTKGRGNSTWAFKAKQPYALKFDSKTSLFGFPKHKRWILLANYRDRTMMRNAVAFEIANRTGLAWTPRTQMVELVMNGKHRGNYMICEQIRIDENRININEMSNSDTEGEAITGGYVLEIDQWNDEVNMFKSQIMENEFGNKSCTIMLKFPDEDDVNAQQVEYIKNYIETVEEEMLAGNFQKVYDEYIDMDSFIDFFFVQELTGNQEPNRGPFSCYMYKDINGKLFAGPVWDFDFTTFIPKYADRFYNYNAAWYKVLLKDMTFRKRMKERWNELKPGFETIPEYIDEMEKMLEKSGKINSMMYSPAIDGDIGGLFNGDEGMSFEKAVARMREFYTAKFKWMDSRYQLW